MTYQKKFGTSKAELYLYTLLEENESLKFEKKYLLCDILLNEYCNQNNFKNAVNMLISSNVSTLIMNNSHKSQQIKTKLDSLINRILKGNNTPYTL